ncbi:ATP-binding protein [Streptomyces sp. CAU 1734]|uniref:ATP-binding protein n=1 Tax=Streptomyces sp. CAU 1734 TaxID=3140360 RepID=UPI0032615C65
MPQFSVRLSSNRRGAHLARLITARQMRSWGLDHRAAEQIVAELAANAAIHGSLPGRDFRLTLILAGAAIRIEVADTRGDRFPGVRKEAEGESGRGLLLVEALAGRWGVTSGPGGGKTVWAECGVCPEAL